MKLKFVLFLMLFVLVSSCKNMYTKPIQVEIHEIVFSKDKYLPIISVMFILKNLSDSSLSYSFPLRNEVGEGVKDSLSYCLLQLPCLEDYVLNTGAVIKEAELQPNSRDGFTMRAGKSIIFKAMEDCKFQSIDSFYRYVIEEGTLLLHFKSLDYSIQFEIKDQNNIILKE